MRLLSWFELRLRAAILLLQIPLRLRRCSLPWLLIKLTPPQPRPRGFSPLQVQRAVDAFVFRPPFRWRPFPRTCLLRSLALYRLMRLEGYEVQFSLGVARASEGGTLDAHSRVLLGREPFAEHEDEAGRFHEIYRYPPLTSTTSSS